MAGQKGKAKAQEDFQREIKDSHAFMNDLSSTQEDHEDMLEDGVPEMDRLAMLNHTLCQHETHHVERHRELEHCHREMETPRDQHHNEMIAKMDLLLECMGVLIPTLTPLSAQPKEHGPSRETKRLFPLTTRHGFG